MTKLHSETLKDKSLAMLKHICADNYFDQFYLAGGTSLSLQIGHRISIDLDLFTGEDFSIDLPKHLNKEYEVSFINKNSIELFTEDTKLFFWCFPFGLTRPLIEFEGIRFADPIDIGLMKLLALQGRHTRKDIVDLYFIDKEIIPLEELLTLFESSYPKESFNSYASLKQLFDYEALEVDANPHMLRGVSWEECLEVVTGKVTGYIRDSLLVE